MERDRYFIEWVPAGFQVFDRACKWYAARELDTTAAREWANRPDATVDPSAARRLGL